MPSLVGSEMCIRDRRVSDDDLTTWSAPTKKPRNASQPEPSRPKPSKTRTKANGHRPGCQGWVKWSPNDKRVEKNRSLGAGAATEKEVAMPHGRLLGFAAAAILLGTAFLMTGCARCSRGGADSNGCCSFGACALNETMMSCSKKLTSIVLRTDKTYEGLSARFPDQTDRSQRDVESVRILGRKLPGPCGDRRIPG